MGLFFDPIVPNPRSFSLVDTCIIPKLKNTEKLDNFLESTFFPKLIHFLVIHDEEAPAPVFTFLWRAPRDAHGTRD